MPATSSAGSRIRDESGFALYELILALAILGMVAAIAVPRMARAPGPTEIGVAAEEIAALFRTDRNMALREREPVVSFVDVEHGIISGASGKVVRIPRGIRFEFVQSSKVLASEGTGVRFLPDGRSSGGVLTLGRDDFAYRISINWLTGGVRVTRPEV